MARLPLRYPPHRIDVSASMLVRAAAGLTCTDERAALQRLERVWGGDGTWLPFFSVRSAFTATLSALDLAPGDEVLVSSINIDDMARIIRAHGLVPVPLDVDPHTLAVSAEAIAALITPSTRAIVVAHLFGGRSELGAVAAVARQHGLLLIEDAAQAFDGTWRGHEQADLTFFSFGTIKTATALGGALVRVRDEALRERMRQVQAGWPRQPRTHFVVRLAKAVLFMTLQTPWLYTISHVACALRGSSAATVARKLSRGFHADDDTELLRAIRRRPSAALLRFLALRLARLDTSRVERRAAHGDRVFASLPPSATPGSTQPHRTHWVVPVTVRDPARLRRRLESEGFAAFGQSNVQALGGDNARELMRQLVFIPAYPELPPSRLEHLIAIIGEHEGFLQIGHRTTKMQP